MFKPKVVEVPCQAKNCKTMAKAAVKIESALFRLRAQNKITPEAYEELIKTLQEFPDVRTV